MLITMLADRFDAGGVLRARGTQVDVANDLALRWIGDGVASPVGDARDSSQGLRKDVPVVQDRISGTQQAGQASVSGAVKILALSAVPIAHTGTTAATVLADVPIPAGVMGINGAIRVTAYWSMTNNANSKNLVITWGGINAQIWSAGLASVAGAACQVMVSNRGSTGSQVFTSTGTGVSFGTLPGFGTASEDTTIAQRIRFTGNLTNAGDTLTLERYVVELLS